MKSGQIMYCLSCGEDVDVVAGWHMQNIMDISTGLWEVDWCSGPFATSAPPEIDLNWEIKAEEPSEEELLEMDKFAEEMMADLP